MRIILNPMSLSVTSGAEEKTIFNNVFILADITIITIMITIAMSMIIMILIAMIMITMIMLIMIKINVIYTAYL